MFRKSFALMAAVSLAVTPTLAQASAQSLSVQPAIERAGAPAGDSELRRRGGFVAPAVAVIIVILGILTATGTIFDDDSRTPSP